MPKLEIPPEWLRPDPEKRKRLKAARKLPETSGGEPVALDPSKQTGEEGPKVSGLISSTPGIERGSLEQQRKGQGVEIPRVNSLDDIPQALDFLKNRLNEVPVATRASAERKVVERIVWATLGSTQEGHLGGQPYDTNVKIRQLTTLFVHLAQPHRTIHKLAKDAKHDTTTIIQGLRSIRKKFSRDEQLKTKVMDLADSFDLRAELEKFIRDMPAK